jgi:thioredoxin-like negative regulator of GroEL
LQDQAASAAIAAFHGGDLAAARELAEKQLVENCQSATLEHLIGLIERRLVVAAQTCRCELGKKHHLWAQDAKNFHPLWGQTLKNKQVFELARPLH